MRRRWSGWRKGTRRSRSQRIRYNLRPRQSRRTRTRRRSGLIIFLCPWHRVLIIFLFATSRLVSQLFTSFRLSKNLVLLFYMSVQSILVLIATLTVRTVISAKSSCHLRFRHQNGGIRRVELLTTMLLTLSWQFRQLRSLGVPRPR